MDGEIYRWRDIWMEVCLYSENSETIEVFPYTNKTISIVVIIHPSVHPKIHLSIHSFIHSGYFYSASSSPLLLRGARDSTNTVPEFHAEAPQATANEGLSQGPYVAARAGVEPTTLRTKGDKSTSEPPCPTRESLTLFLREWLIAVTV